MAICGNARGILVIVEGESGRELQFGSFTRVGCFSQRKIRGAGAGAAERAGRLAFEAANPLLKPLLKLCQTGPLLIVATRQGRLAGEPADPSPLEILSVSSDDADEKQEEQDGGVVSASSHSSKQNQNTEQ
jgi:hypothetical protein